MTPSLTCILGFLNVDLDTLAQSATVRTHLFTTSVSVFVTTTVTNLMRGVQDRLILDTFDVQNDFETQPRDFLGLTYTDIRMHHSTISDFFLACPGSSDLDRAQEARWLFFFVRISVLLFIPMFGVVSIYLPE